MKLQLVRHGETHSNVKRALDTACPGADLTDRGRDQAAALVAAFDGRRIDAIYTSTRVRTQQTAAPLLEARGLEATALEGLSEIQAGKVEMATDEASRRIYVDTLTHWTVGNYDHRMPGAETGHEFLARFDAAVAEIAASGVESVVAFGHAAAIHAWVNARSDLAALGERAFQPIHNTGGCELEGEPGSWHVVDWHPKPYGALTQA